jgi:hypothetical protein
MGTVFAFDITTSSTTIYDYKKKTNISSPV